MVLHVALWIVAVGIGLALFVACTDATKVSNKWAAVSFYVLFALVVVVGETVQVFGSSTAPGWRTVVWPAMFVVLNVLFALMISLSVSRRNK